MNKLLLALCCLGALVALSESASTSRVKRWSWSKIAWWILSYQAVDDDDETQKAIRCDGFKERLAAEQKNATATGEKIPELTGELREDILEMALDCEVEIDGLTDSQGKELLGENNEDENTKNNQDEDKKE